MWGEILLLAESVGCDPDVVGRRGVTARYWAQLRTPRGLANEWFYKAAHGLIALPGRAGLADGRAYAQCHQITEWAQTGGMYGIEIVLLPRRNRDGDRPSRGMTHRSRRDSGHLNSVHTG
jgi:hypothetical protein